LLAFEESAGDLAENVASLGFDLKQLEADGLLVIDAFRVDPAEIVETGAFDLDGLFIRLGYAVESIGAKRVVLDTIEVLFDALGNDAIIRAELGRLFRWMKDRGLTAVVTGEKGPNLLTRHGIGEYVSDCVIVLDHRVRDELSKRRLRVVKYRGTLHGTDEYPFLITDRGLVVLPITSVGLNYEASTDRVSTGVERLDHMLGGGIYRGTTTLISGEAGTGKTTLAAKMIEAACQRGERALYITFEESSAQLARNLASVGIDLRRWIDQGLLRIWASRPNAYGLEMHLVTLLRLVEEFEPSLVALDPMTALEHVGEPGQVTSAVTREIDLLKARGTTAVVTSLSHVGTGAGSETSSMAVTSLMDTWLLLRNVETDGERNRLLFVRKSRGSAHSNQVREFRLSERGPELLDVYVGPHGVLTGSARLTQEAEDRREAARRAEEVERRRRALRRRSVEVETRIEALRAELAAETAEVEQLAAEVADSEARYAADATAIARHRWADTERPAHTPQRGDHNGRG
jgi:circadian clock protein KaiC